MKQLEEKKDYAGKHNVDALANAQAKGILHSVNNEPEE